MYDTLCPLALTSNEITPCDYTNLKKILREGEGLPFRCVFEENQLKRVLKDMNDLVQDSNLILTLATNAAMTLNSNFFENHISPVESAPTPQGKDKEKEGANRNRAKATGKNTKRNLSAKDREDLKLSNLLGTCFLKIF